ncbi:MAG: flagellar hook-basal body complex protein, partial [Planctomycetaceae bacterium]
MASSLTTGVTGLTSHQKLLEVIGNNLANLNTTAYKRQRALFSDLFYETIQSASGGTPGVLGGTNPIQVGSGSRVSQINLVRTQGNLVATGTDLDMAIDGDGFFVVHTGTDTRFTRAGAFSVDNNGILVDPTTGFRVQRFGTIGEATTSGGGFQVSGDNDIRIPYGATIPGRLTSTIGLSGNLPADALGPIAEVLENQSNWTTGAASANASTLLNSLDLNSIDYGPGDMLNINGTAPDGTVISTSFSVDGTTTLGDLVAAIDAAFPGATASLGANGRIVLTSDTKGDAFLSLAITDAAGNTGSTAFSTNSFLVYTNGKNGDVVRGGVDIFDAAGGPHTITLEYEKQDDGSWVLNARPAAGDGTAVDGIVTGIRFNSDGSLAQAGGIGTGNTTLTFQFPGVGDPVSVNVTFGTPGEFSGMTQLAADAIFGATQDGTGAGTLSRVQINSDGIVNGIATNGTVVPIAQLAIANFANTAGLNSQGGNYFSVSLSSGPAEYGTGLVGGRGAVRGGQLEQSNVD